MPLDDLITRTLPYRSALPIVFKRAQRYYSNNIVDRYSNRDLEVLEFLKGHNERRTLLTGNQKSGNTWTRFVVANYFRILNGGDPEVALSFDELYRIQSNVLEYKEMSSPPKGYPLFFYSHQHYRKVFNEFDNVIYVYRNPMDTLISYYYFTTQRETPFASHQLSEAEKERLLNIDEFVLHFLLNWILFHVRTIGHASVTLCYEMMQIDPVGQFYPVIERMTGNVNKEILESSIQISSFKNIRSKQLAVGKPQGHSSSDLKVQFTRDGTSGQYLQELQPSTIEKVEWALQKFGIELNGQ